MSETDSSRNKSSDGLYEWEAKIEMPAHFVGPGADPTNEWFISSTDLFKLIQEHI